MGLFDKKKKVVLEITGMKCEKCVAKVENALKPFGKAEVDLKLGSAVVTVPEKIAADELKAAVEAVGFGCEVK